MQYLSVVLPAMGASIALPFVGAIQLPILFITIGVLILLGFLNWIGISESAKVSLVGAIIAFISDIAILVTVFMHISLAEVFALFREMFSAHALTPVSLLIGFAGSFLAFSGLESISQLSPVMKVPRKRVAGLAMFLVVITIGLTSPLLTMFSTLLQPRAAADPVLSSQLISLLGGHWGSSFLQTEVAISASALLIFASNTAIIGAYHVFMALSRLGFFPELVLRRNRLRGTPHYSILLATSIPIVILLLVLGNINTLGDMYAFGLLGAFTLTCLGMDIVRRRDRRAARILRERRSDLQEKEQRSFLLKLREFWHSLDFWLGILTTGLVMLAWSTNLIARPLATVFGGSITLIGMVIAYFHYRYQESQGQATVQILPLSSVEVLPDATLAVLFTGQERANSMVIEAAINDLNGKPIAFLYIGEPKNAPPLRPFEFYDPYLYDEAAIQTFRKAQKKISAVKPNASPRFFYRPLQELSESQEAAIVLHIWRTMHPHELMIAADDISILEDINPNRIRYNITPKGKVAHLFAKW
jgi:amino acid transporter